MNKFIKFIHNPIVYISISLLIIALLLVIFWDNEEYRANAVTEIVSIVITIAIVDVSIKRNDKKQKNKKKKTELLRLHNIFNIYITQYQGAYERIFGKEELKYSDMSKLLKPSPTRFNLSIKPAFYDFFRLWLSMFRQAEEFLEKLDLGEDDDLINILTIFIEQNIFAETLFESFKEREKIYTTNKPIFDLDVKMLENANEKYKITDISNTNDLYSITFDLIDVNSNFIKYYLDIINKSK